MKKNKNAKKFKQPTVDNSRKAQRKQKRLQKKVHRQEHYLKKKTIQETPKYTPGRFVKRPIDNAKNDTDFKKKKPKLQPLAQDMLTIEREKELKEANKLKSEMEDRRRDMLVKANDDEDKIIKKLEKQLGLNKSKNKNNFFANDGLDYLLEICDRSTSDQIVAAEKHLAEVEGDSDFDEDLAAVTGKKVDKNTKKSKKKDVDNDQSESNDELDDYDDVSGDGDDDIGDLGDDSEEEMSENEDLSENEALSDEEGSLEESNDGESVNNSNLSENSDHFEEPEEKLSKSQISKELKESKVEKLEKSKMENKSKPAKSKERVVKADNLSKVFSDDEISHLSGDDDLEKFSGDELNDDDDISSEKKNEKPDVWEDIYGRKRDKDGNVIKEDKGVYVPPHLRNKDSSTDQQLAQLKRQIKSVLNKLAGSNLHWASSSIEALYSNNSRHSVNTALGQVWTEAAVSYAVAPDRLLAEHAALIAVLHANVGSEIGAHFLQDLVKRFDLMMQGPQPMEDKRLDNLMACLAHLYNFQIYDTPLLYDMLTRLLDTLTEKYIDCVLVALRCCGGTLRRRSPRQLQQLVHDVQPKAVGLSEGVAAGTRIKFLLEVVMAIKNNNLMKIPNYDPSYQEHLKKMIRTIIRKGNYVTPLNIRLEDLLKADERGKWWVVGSAWEGTTTKDDQPKKDVPEVSTRDQKLLELARKQRMNTDVRRSIFCVIMAAEDYMDAFEKLQHLGLRAQQEREIAHVAIACCLSERAYNPYYAVLAGKLCSTERKYQLSFQFAVWDKIKDLENLAKQGLTNLAQFIIHLIMEKVLPLSVLKVIQFSDLNKNSVRFMRQILLSIIMNEDLQGSLEVFHRVSKSPKLHVFRESLRLFIQHFLVKNAGKKSNVLSHEDMATLKERAVEVDRILTMYESKLKF